MYWTLILPPPLESDRFPAQLRAIRRQTRSADCVQVWADAVHADLQNKLAQGLPDGIELRISRVPPKSGWVWVLQGGAIPISDALETLDQRATRAEVPLMRINVLNKTTGTESAVAAWERTEYAEPRNVRDEWWEKEYPCGDPLCAWVADAATMEAALEAGSDVLLQKRALDSGMMHCAPRVAYRDAHDSDWSVQMDLDPAAAMHACEQAALLLGPQDRQSWLVAVRKRVHDHQTATFAAALLDARQRYRRVVPGNAGRLAWSLSGLLRRWMQRQMEKALNG